MIPGGVDAVDVGLMPVGLGRRAVRRRRLPVLQSTPQVAGSLASLGPVVPLVRLAVTLVSPVVTLTRSPVTLDAAYGSWQRGLRSVALVPS